MAFLGGAGCGRLLSAIAAFTFFSPRYLISIIYQIFELQTYCGNTTVQKAYTYSLVSRVTFLHALMYVMRDRVEASLTFLAV